MSPSYELSCNDCAFRTAVRGEYPEVFDEIQSHKREMADEPGYHNIDVTKQSDPSPRPD